MPVGTAAKRPVPNLTPVHDCCPLARCIIGDGVGPGVPDHPCAPTGQERLEHAAEDLGVIDKWTMLASIDRDDFHIGKESRAAFAVPGSGFARGVDGEELYAELVNPWKGPCGEEQLIFVFDADFR